jgi:hypothetical protein
MLYQFTSFSIQIHAQEARDMAMWMRGDPWVGRRNTYSASIITGATPSTSTSTAASTLALSTASVGEELDVELNCEV